MNQSATIMRWSDFPMISTAAELEEYLKVRPSGHKYYYHYTSLGAINAILSGGFCVSCVGRFNDKIEKNAFSGMEKKFYSLCFSTGGEENLALWYLYSGVRGTGGRLQFSYNAICKLMNASAKLVEYDYQSHSIIKEIAVLTKDNAKIKLEDIIYGDRSKKNHGMDLKYNTMTNRGRISEEEWGKYVSRHRGFQKRQIWYYEKETRLLIELSDSLYHSLDANKSYAVILEIPEKVLRFVKVRFAPNISALDDPAIGEYSNLKALQENEISRLQLSDHAGTVEINPCRYCTEKKKE